MNWVAPNVKNIQPAANDKNGIFIYVEEWLGHDRYELMEPQHRPFTPEELSQMRSDAATGRKGDQTLKFNENGKFKIMQTLVNLPRPIYKLVMWMKFF